MIQLPQRATKMHEKGIAMEGTFALAGKPPAAPLFAVIPS
jgi:hypothetical protein